MSQSKKVSHIPYPQDVHSICTTQLLIVGTPKKFRFFGAGEIVLWQKGLTLHKADLNLFPNTPYHPLSTSRNDS